MSNNFPWVSVNSSNIDKIKYDADHRVLTAVFNNSHAYEYYGVPYEDYINVIEGRHACSTSGSTPYGSFWRGKDPSVGSAFNFYIIKGGYDFKRIR